jgi:hypothetical protein
MLSDNIFHVYFIKFNNFNIQMDDRKEKTVQMPASNILEIDSVYHTRKGKKVPKCLVVRNHFMR